MRQHGGCGAAPRRGNRRGRRLGNGIAGTAGIFGTHVADHLEVARYAGQHFGDVLAQLAHAAAAGRAIAGAVAFGLMQQLKTWQVIGERLALWLCPRGGWSFGLAGPCPGDMLGFAGLQLLKLQLQLFDLARDPLRGPAELHPAQPGDLKAQFFYLQRLELHRGLGRLQLTLAGQRKGAQGGWIGRQFGRGERHAEIYQGQPRRTTIQVESVIRQTNIGCAVGGGAIARRQSMASTNMENCAGVSVIAPSTMGGDEAPFLKPFGNQPHASAVPIQGVEIIGAFATEDEQVAAERISTDDLLGLGRKTIEPVAQIDWAAGEKHLGSGCQAGHVRPLMARSTRDKALSLTDASTLIRAPPGQRQIDGSSFAFLRQQCRGKRWLRWRQTR